MELLRPRALKKGDAIGIVTPSTPGYCLNPGLFENGIRVLEGLGFKVKLGHLTAMRKSQGYRSGSPQERAREVMDLIHDDEVHAIITTIGGANSSSLIPYLDFEAIRSARKIFCGYSDITSLHLAILHYACLSTFYGPGLMTWFGEWPNGLEYSNRSFLDATCNAEIKHRRLSPPHQWSNHKRDWSTDAWKTLPREFQSNDGWRVLNPGTATAPLIAANLNTLLSAAGTPHFPDLNDKILLIEEMDAPLSEEERALRHLQLMGVFERIAGLVVSKPEFYRPEGAPFDYDALILETVGRDAQFPIVSNFDCGHTVPMLTLAQHVMTRITAETGKSAEVEILEPMVAMR